VLRRLGSECGHRRLEDRERDDRYPDERVRGLEVAAAPRGGKGEGAGKAAEHGEQPGELQPPMRHQPRTIRRRAYDPPVGRERHAKRKAGARH
jgi:hypothetical protein